MKLRHSTPRDRVTRILAEGLDPIYAVTQADQKWIWLHTRQQTPWAIGHTSRRKQVAEQDVMILEVEVPRRWLRRAWRGVWKCPDRIPPERIRVLQAYEQSAVGHD